MPDRKTKVNMSVVKWPSNWNEMTDEEQIKFTEKMMSDMLGGAEIED